MKISLKKLAQQREALDHAIRTLAPQASGKNSAKHLKNLQTLLEEVDRDLEMCGESIVELDKPRLEAVEERNKMLSFLDQADEP